MGQICPTRLVSRIVVRCKGSGVQAGKGATHGDCGVPINGLATEYVRQDLPEIRMQLTVKY